MRNGLLLIAAIVLTAASAKAAPKVIYGQDNRLDYHQAPFIHQVVANAVAVQMGPRSMEKSGDEFVFRTNRTLGERHNLCAGERFIDQPTRGDCSAFLVSPTKLVTAGHCNDLVPYNMCEQASWVFGYHADPSGNIPNSVPASEVYKCKRIIAKEFDGEKDFAVIELDRPVTNRPHLKLAKLGSPRVNDDLLMIGFPDGIPMKVASNGKILSQNSLSFQASLDAFHGNSGSVVLDQNSLEVVGILVAGNPDYQRGSSEQGRCQVVNKCDEQGHSCEGDQDMRGEKVSGLAQFIEFI